MKKIFVFFIQQVSLFFFSNRAFAILLEYVLVDHTEIDIDM